MFKFKALASYKKADELDVEPGPLHELGHEDEPGLPSIPKGWGDRYVNPAIRSMIDEGGNLGQVASNVLHALQDVEEIWGAGGDPEGYIKFMEALKSEVEERLTNARVFSEEKGPLMPGGPDIENPEDTNG